MLDNEDLVLQDYFRDGNEDSRSWQSASNRGDLDFTNLVKLELLVCQNEDIHSVENPSQGDDLSPNESK